MQDYFHKAELNLKKFWGFNGFRPGQDEVVKSVFDGKETLVLFPTGGGKSLCYQVPATVFEGMTLVISPLVALMQDQVQQLKSKGVSATFINSTIPSYEVEQRLVNARNGMYKLLYCAPERLKTSLWEAELPRLNIDLVAIDEAHCISEWGHDFRPSYRDIKTSLESIADQTRWIALTATATPEVQKDIVESLGYEAPNVISRGFSRPNLKWWVVKSPKKKQKLEESVQKGAQKGDGLIYGGTRKNCEHLADRFSRLGIKTEAYHAGVESEKRKAIQQRWITGETPLVAATNAFGMGIDKPDCRYVIHEEMPYSLEAYYQEAGRAGRDGEESFPILLYRESDYYKADDRIDQSYPTLDELDHVYQILCDSFYLAVGS
ncbi:MAG: RecQ family ATP-dependent DNA helicase, partial [Balneola sp.]|nr:RecQ family ATP-dependent DNA helicase [Balneola sp.]